MHTSRSTVGVRCTSHHTSQVRSTHFAMSLPLSYQNSPRIHDGDGSDGVTLLRDTIKREDGVEPAAPRRCCTTGTFRVALGAALFAATNAAATALFRRGGASVVSLYILRSPLIYLANAGIVALRGSEDGRTTVANVMWLRTGSPVASRLAMLRSFLNSTKAVLLGVGFVFLTYADAFVVFKGVGVFGTIIVARCMLGRGERLSPRELACGALVLVGILLIVEAPSVALSTAAASHRKVWEPRRGAGVVLVAVAGLLSAFSGTLMRHLSEAGGPHDGHTPPAMLLSYLTVMMFVVFGGVAAIGAATGLAAQPAWSWSALLWPQTATDWALVGTNCACTIGAHLATASGYSTTRAGIVAFLQLTEIPWVYLLDVLVLDEATSTLKSVGSAVVFASAVAVAVR